MNSCVYEGSVFHGRKDAVDHAFSVPLFLVYLDLDELPALCENTPGWSQRRFAPTQFRRGDFLGDPALPLGDAVRKHVESVVGVRPSGPIRLLTQLRYWGLIFNPVSFYYCFAEDGESVEWVVADVTNIPWRERHAYVVPFGDGTAHLDKQFFVSPFLGMDLDYTWHFDVPGDTLRFAMLCHRAERRVFEARLSMRRRPLEGASRAGIWWRHPWMSARTIVSIYWQAFRLRLKGAPVYAHPSGPR